MINIIIPVFNEEKVIYLFYRELCKHIDQTGRFSITFVNDGSTDNSLEIIKNLAAKDRRILYISLIQNYGQQAAIYTGLKLNKAEAVIVLDCDLQDPPKLIPKMVEAWHEGTKIVLPLRQSRQDTFFKRIFAWLFYALLNSFSKPRLNANVGEFYLLDKVVIKEILSNVCMPLFLRGQIQRLKCKKKFLPYERAGRRSGKSGFSTIKMFKLATDAYSSGRSRKSSLPDFDIAESNILRDKSALIIGAGVSGLVAAYRLSLLGAKTCLYEKNSSIGGLASSELLTGALVDRHYHHIFKNDKEFLALLESLSLSAKLRWQTSRVAALWQKKLWAMDSLLNFLQLPLMAHSSKIRMLLGAYLFSKSAKISPQQSASNVISKIFGEVAWQRFWRTIFEAKFGRFSAQISAAWFHSRIKTRSKSRNRGGEILGYLEGGFGTVIQGLKQQILCRHGKIFVGSEISRITKSGNHFNVCRSPKHSKQASASPNLSPTSFDFCLSTLPPSETSKIFPAYKPTAIEYIGFVGAIVSTKKAFSHYYWINVLDTDAPFGVVVEQNNLASPSSSSPRILYLGKYSENTSDFYGLADKKISKVASDWLEKIKPEAKKDIIEIKIVREPYAQPIITTHYLKPPHICKVGGFYATSMAHIFPEDRGLNQAVREANGVVKMIINDTFSQDTKKP